MNKSLRHIGVGGGGSGLCGVPSCGRHFFVFPSSGRLTENNVNAREQNEPGFNVGNTSYTWDANGNQIYRVESQNGYERFMCWDEENRLMAVRDLCDKPIYSAYIYDAGGERAWKLASDVVAMYINGQGTNYAELVKTLYVNPYMVVTEQEYTKHYYIEGERICTKIGSGFGPGPNIPYQGELPLMQGDYDTLQQELWDMTLRFVECAQGPEITIGDSLAPCYLEGDEAEPLQYFYHSDHLGSSSFITNTTGYAEQHLQYLPMGELFANQQSSSFDTRYKFSAKELDDETQYSYFGARYYDSDLSVWLSVDPLADKYPSLSPFAYCANNPVVLVDPDGMKIKGFSIDEDGNIVEDDRASKRAHRIYNGMSRTPEGYERFKAMVSSPTKVRLSITKEPLYDDNNNQVRARTYPGHYVKKTGLYRRALVVFSTASIEGDRFQYAENEDNIFNVSGTHESWHAVDKEQIAKDNSTESGTWSAETTPIQSELKSWIQWSNKFTGDYRYLPNYNNPDPNNILKGEPKPAFISSEPISLPKRPAPRWTKPKGV